MWKRREKVVYSRIRQISRIGQISRLGQIGRLGQISRLGQIRIVETRDDVCMIISFYYTYTYTYIGIQG